MTTMTKRRKNACQNSKPVYRTFRLGQELLREGETGDEAYLILSGQVEVRKGMAGTNPRTVAVLDKGAMIGELSLFDAHAHSATAIATKETKVSVLTRGEFDRRTSEMDPLLKAVMGVTVKRLRAVLESRIPKDAPVNWEN